MSSDKSATLYNVVTEHLSRRRGSARRSQDSGEGEKPTCAIVAVIDIFIMS